MSTEIDSDTVDFFLRACVVVLGNMLQDTEGMIVDVPVNGDLGNLKKMLIYAKNKQIHFCDAGEYGNIDSGSMTWVHDDPNEKTLRLVPPPE